MTQAESINKPQAWINGQVVPFTAASVPVWDLGVVAGAAVSEMARTYRHSGFRLATHLDRLLESCRELEFALPYSRDTLQQTAEELIRTNCQLIGDSEDLGVVFFVTAGANGTYLGGRTDGAGTVCVHTFPLPLSRWKDAVGDGVRLSIVPQRQISDESLPVHCKIRNRLHWMLADREAERMESGSRALLLNQDGLVTETSTACFYAVIDGVIKTAARDVLKSTTRALVEELAAAESLPFSVTDFTAEDLSGATEAFISSTPCGLLPVRSVNRQAIGGSVPGPVLRQLQVAWTAMTGLDTVQQILQHNSGAA